MTGSGRMLIVDDVAEPFDFQRPDRAIAGRPAEAALHLTGLARLVTVAGRLGDRSAAGRSVIETALETVDVAHPPR
jgi:hypothetical protein